LLAHIQPNATKILGINNKLVDFFTLSKYYKTSITINTPISLFRKLRNADENANLAKRNMTQSNLLVILF
jgi:hypothetical protein